MKNHQRTIGKNNEWLTPRCILQKMGVFDLDPAAPVIRPWETAISYFTIEDDGLSKEWTGRVWLNPPFNRYQRPKWMHRMAEHRNGIMLIPAATETEAFHEFVWKRALAVCFVRGRPHFCDVAGKSASFNCGTAICLVAYTPDNAFVLKRSELGRVITL